MQLEKYELEKEPSATVYEFTSIDPKGKIIKLIQFQTTDNPQLYNLAFGDKNLLNGEIDDYAISDNGDTEKVLATVTDALLEFLGLYLGAWVYATGSTPGCTRLYQMGVAKYFHLIEMDFELLHTKAGTGTLFKKEHSMKLFWLGRKSFKLQLMKKNVSTDSSIKINKSLEAYKDKILFPEKLAKANEMLKKAGLPKKVFLPVKG